MNAAELGKILDVDCFGLDAAVREFVAKAITHLGRIEPVVFLRATRDPASGKPLDAPTLTAMVIQGELAEERKSSISQAVKSLAGIVAAEWVVFVLPGTLTIEGESSEIVLIATEHDRGNDAFAAFVVRDRHRAAVSLVRRVQWSTAQAWLEGLLEAARSRRLDLS